MAAVLAWLLWSAVSSWAQGASGDAQTIIHVDASSTSDRPPPILGLEAYREVIETGNYIVGPGDKFLVYVSGVENPFTSQVLAEGGLFIPQVGTINIGGMRLRDARQKIKERFRLVLKVGEIDFELSQPRHFPVSITGLVAQPGVKIATGVERVSEVLSSAGGLNTMASTRNIRILKTARLVPSMRSALESAIAAGKMGSIDDLPFEIVDLERYKITGDSRYNPYVEDGDIIMVPPQAGQIGAMGALQRPDFFEFVPGDRLSDLLLLALGPAVNADTDNVILFRYEEDMTTRISREVDLEGVLAGDPEADMLLKSEDWLNVRAIPEYHSDSQVFISGEVKYPGYYVLE
ncbi:MAG: SLBB domain-containing protein, partial [Candidatus Latescibacteria bacterium]|nr:SLBB domain-containing protein [Candidatus Latescibacterota bacterium]